jgi:GT2 family glycosyltransferase
VTLFRRDVFRKVGLFDERMTQAEDRDICLRAYCKSFQSFYISTAAHDINRWRPSDVSVTTPLRQYLRSIHKKLSYTPTHPRVARRQTLTSVVVSQRSPLFSFAAPDLCSE